MEKQQKKQKPNNSNGMAIFLAGVIISLSIVVSTFSSFDLPFDGVLRTENGTSVISESTNAVYTQDVLFEIAEGEIPSYSKVHKFGAGELTTTMKPITQGGFYRTPTSPVTLEFVSNNAADNVTGIGAREITVIGLNGSWEEIEVTINTAGLTPVTLPEDFTRVYRWYVSSSGTYATQTVGSHQGTLTLREAGAGQTWSIIPNSPFPVGQSEIGVYTIPKDKTGYLLSKFIFTDTSKTADIFFFQRCNINDTTTPYSTMRLVEREIGITGPIAIQYKIPKGKFIGPCDVGFMGKVSTGTAAASVEFELILDNE